MMPNKDRNNITFPLFSENQKFTLIEVFLFSTEFYLIMYALNDMKPVIQHPTIRNEIDYTKIVF